MNLDQHTPRPMVAIVALNLFVWLVIIPIGLYLQSGDVNWVYFAFLGVVIAAIIVLSVFLARAILYLYSIAYWYVQGCLSLFGLIFGVLTFFSVITQRAGRSENVEFLTTFLGSGLLAYATIVFVSLGITWVVLSAFVWLVRKREDLDEGYERTARSDIHVHVEAPQVWNYQKYEAPRRVPRVETLPPPAPENWELDKDYQAYLERRKKR